MKTFLKKVAIPLTLIIFSICAGSMALSGTKQLIPNAFAEGGEEEVFYYLQDHLGGIDAVVDEDGAVVERKDYLPFGDERMTVGDDEEDYGYTGKEKDDETGLNYYGARYYDSKLGRFTQLDPLVMNSSDKPFSSVLDNPQALNGYSYVLNNPLKFVDENGMYEIDVHFDLTLYLCKQAGFSDGDALQIAFYDQYTDTNPETSPWNADNGWKHFANQDVANSWINKAITDNSLSKFGESLHYVQDTYSHYSNGYIWTKGGHILDSFLSNFGIKKSPDKTYNDIEKSNAMTKDSFYKIREMNKKSNGMGELTSDGYDKETERIWNDINPITSKFNSSTDSEKSTYFKQSGYEKIERLLSNKKPDKK